MASVLLVDDAQAFAELMADALASALDCSMTVVHDPAAVTVDYAASERFDVAMVDLSFANSPLSGLDVLLAISEGSASTRLVILTQGDEWVADLLRMAWEAVPVATALSKNAPVRTIASTVESVLSTGHGPVDPVLAPLLPTERSPLRMASEFGRLVRHRGHAKMWKALIEADGDPSYAELRNATGLRINTLRNYREQVVSELAFHGLHSPTMREICDFAHLARPLLLPHIQQKLDEPVGRPASQEGS